jgi:hypothetical protein
MVRSFVHFGVLCTAKYRYGENCAANPNFKNLFNTLEVQILVKNALIVFQTNPQICFFRRKIP